MGASRNAWVHVRVSEDEKSLLLNNAAALDMSPSSYVRAILQIPIRVVGSVDEGIAATDGNPNAELLIVYDRASVHQLTRQLRAWGHHYNQAVHALNTINAKPGMSRNEMRGYMNKALVRLNDIDAYRKKLERTVAYLLSGFPVRG